MPAARTLLIVDVQMGFVNDWTAHIPEAVENLQAGIEPVVLADHCASHGGPECHEAGLLLLRRFVGAGQIVDAAQAIGAG